MFWNTRDPGRVALAYTEDSRWRNRSEFLHGRPEIVASLTRNEHGIMRRRIASINDLPIAESERKYRWPLGRRPDDHPGLTELGL
jgi:nuclear transport factor 2 (NTF2) superfamily protein